MIRDIEKEEREASLMEADLHDKSQISRMRRAQSEASKKRTERHESKERDRLYRQRRNEMRAVLRGLSNEALNERRLFPFIHEFCWKGWPDEGLVE